MTALAVAVEGFGPASLVAVYELADLQTRVDRKYIVDVGVAHTLMASLAHDVLALDIDGRRSFGYRSRYFDTLDLALYRAAAHRRRRRLKVRTREYDSSDVAMLEVKTRGSRGRTIKTRQEWAEQGSGRFGIADKDFVDSAAAQPGLASTLRPTLTTEYKRVTLLDAAHRSRVTFDEGVVCTDWSGAAVRLDGVVVETKSPGSASRADRALWRMGIRPIRMSKYCTSLAVLHPELPSNRWHRTIRRHFE